MPRFDLDEVEDALGFEQSNREMEFSDVVTDTRKLKRDALFIAFKGERFNGEDFLKEAVKKGATGVVVSESCLPEKLAEIDAVVFKVKDTVEAYQQLAAYHRQRFSLPVIAITGSNGKTTTKDLTAAVLSAKYKVLKTAANFNNEIGLPLTLLSLTEKHQAAVVEIGMRGLGQIAALAPIAEPSIGVVTNVGETHMELLGSIENIAQAKAELVEAIKPGGVVILNADNHWVAEMNSKAAPGVKVITFGIDKPADIQAMNLVQQDDQSTVFDCRIGGKLCMFRVPMVGRHNVYNALAAIAVGWTLNLTPTDIQMGFANLKLTGMRFGCTKKGKCTIVNDAYNASPMSMSAAISTLKEIAEGRRILVLGDMLELGDSSKNAHAKVGKEVAESGADVLITMGTLAEDIANGAETMGMKNVFRTKDHAEAAEKIKEIMKSGDTILFKGSRGMRMEKIIDLL